jgi:hypothetical protein
MFVVVQLLMSLKQTPKNIPLLAFVMHISFHLVIVVVVKESSELQKKIKTTI